MRLLKNNRRKNRLIIELYKENSKIREDIRKLEMDNESCNRESYRHQEKVWEIEEVNQNLETELNNYRRKLTDAQEPFKKEIETLLEIKRKYFDLVRTLKLDKNDKRKA